MQSMARIIAFLTDFGRAAWVFTWLACALASCNSAGSRAPAANRHEDARGYTVDLPEGWSARSDAATGRIDLQSKSARVSIQPMFARAPMGSGQASAALVRLAAKLWPDVQWQGPPEAAAANAVRMRGSGENLAASAILVWTSTPAGSPIVLYALAAPPNEYARTEAAFVRILSSFRISGRESSKASVAYERWTDPAEQAFSFETPKGWRTEGGLMRLSAVDPRAVWKITSPDGSITVMGGDASIPVFTLPNPTLAMAGFVEGSWYSPGYGVRMLVRRYAEGTAFAREYVIERVAPGCQDLRFVDQRGRPDVVEAMNRLTAQAGLPTQLTAGEVAFACRRNGAPMIGYLLAGTRLTGSAGGGIWNVEHLIGFLAAENSVPVAQEVMAHILSSSQLNPRWVAMQQNLTGSVADIVAKTQAELSRLSTDSYWARHANDSEMSRKRSNATLGVVDVDDPLTGRSFQVESGSNYYWVDPKGRIAGTQTDTIPSVDFRQLISRP